MESLPRQALAKGDRTRPKIVCLLSSQGVDTVVIKNLQGSGTSMRCRQGAMKQPCHNDWKACCLKQANSSRLIQVEAYWEPLVPGPAFAIDKVKGRSWRKLRLNSSSNWSPHMLCPPVPSPANS